MHASINGEDSRPIDRVKYFTGPGGIVVRKKNPRPQSSALESLSKSTGQLKIVSSESEVKKLLYAQAGPRTPQPFSALEHSRNEGPDYLSLQRSLYSREPRKKMPSYLKQRGLNSLPAIPPDISLTMDLDNSLLKSTNLLPLAGPGSVYEQLSFVNTQLKMSNTPAKRKLKRNKIRVPGCPELNSSMDEHYYHFLEEAEKRRAGIIDGHLSASEYFINPPHSPITRLATQACALELADSQFQGLRAGFHEHEQRLQKAKTAVEKKRQAIQTKIEQFNTNPFLRRMMLTRIVKGWSKMKYYHSWQQWLHVDMKPHVSTLLEAVEAPPDNNEQAMYISTQGIQINETDAIAAAIRIQSCCRKHLACKHFQRLKDIKHQKDQESAALKLQAASRGFLVRKDVYEKYRILLLSALKEVGNGKLSNVLNIKDLKKTELAQIKKALQLATCQSTNKCNSTAELKEMLQLVQRVQEKRKKKKELDKEKWVAETNARRNKTEGLLHF